MEILSLSFEATFLKDIGHDEAKERLQGIIDKGYLVAAHPLSKPPSTVMVTAKFDDAHHILYKDRSDSTNREACEENYRKSHGERIQWIPKVLYEPDEIFCYKNDAGALRSRPKFRPPRTVLYTASMLQHERMIVVVRTNGLDFWLVTAYDFDLRVQEDRTQWANERSRYEILWRQK